MKSFVSIGFGHEMKHTDMIAAQIKVGDKVNLFEGVCKGVINYFLFNFSFRIIINLF